MLIFPAETAHAHLSRRFHDGHIENLTADFPMRRLALLFGKANEGLVGNGLNEAIAQEIQRKPQCADRLGLWNALLNFLVGKRTIGANGAIIHQRAAGNHLRSVSDGDVGSAKVSVRPLMTDSQFRHLRRCAGHGTLVAFGAGLRIVQRSKSITQLLDSLELHLISLVRYIIDDAVGLVVKASWGLWKTRGGGN